MLKRSWVAVLSITLSSTCFAQSTPVLENNATRLKWNQINTNNFRILFPQGFETKAQHVANMMEHMREPEATSLGAPPKKISILLQNQSSESNGFVTVAPRRSEFFTMPSQDYNFTGTNDWLTLLAAHEYRHMVQFQHSLRGFNRLAYYIFGQLGFGAMAFVSAPLWFWEGDAVVAETAFTGSGRGRIPNFDRVFRMNLLEGRTFNYHKQYLRSYKHQIPNHYVLGYHMVSYLRLKTENPEIWSSISKHAWNYSFVPFTFSNSIKKESGLFVTELYNEMATHLKEKWKADLEALELTKFESLSPRKNSSYTDYLYPQVRDNGSIVALKRGIGDIDQLVVLNNGEEKKIFVLGPLNDAGMLSSANGIVVWNEYRYDPRWRMKTHSVILSYDINAKTKRVISKNSRYAAAAISPDALLVATIETDESYQTSLVVLDAQSGEVVKKFENEENAFISMPSWSQDGAYIVCLKTVNGIRSIVKIEINSSVEQELLNLNQENAGNPVLFEHFLFYNSPYSGIDNIYAFNLNTKKTYQVTSSKYGAYNVSIDRNGETIYYSDQSRDGLNIVKAPFLPATWKLIDGLSKQPAPIYQQLAEQEGHENLFENTPSEEYPVKKYNKMKGMINPHTWGPYTNSGFNTLDIGILSKDILSTTEIGAGAKITVDERNPLWYVNASYQGFYPIIDLEISKGDREVNEGLLPGFSQDLIFNWSETTVEGGLRIPWIFTQSKFNTRFTLGNAMGKTDVTDFVNSIDGGGRFIPVDSTSAYFFRTYTDNGNLFYNRFSVDFSNLLNRSRRDIFPAWGQTFRLENSNSIGQSDFSGKNFSFITSLFFPGFAKHHSINGYWGYQQTLIENKIENYYFRNRLPVPRGHSVRRFANMYTMSANYTLPLWYPDIALGPIVNFQRLRANLFFDYGFGETKLTNSSQVYTSIGGELKIDINVLRLLQQFNLGVRYSYPVETGVGQFEFIIGNLGF